MNDYLGRNKAAEKKPKESIIKQISDMSESEHERNSGTSKFKALER